MAGMLGTNSGLVPGMRCLRRFAAFSFLEARMCAACPGFFLEVEKELSISSIPTLLSSHWWMYSTFLLTRLVALGIICH